ncbi:hypothetical protein IFM89_019112 [Coptis chinensis]|uniref:14-3-3 domain-containing protein n=1 Tax=Coptis chinensis TaxID=261450 RepID=A0A835HWW2_9MAGN|nr:hypothetical protein IFM89_019112 [Coptis chinensis]
MKRSKIETELSSICDGILRLLDTRLIPSASSGDSKIFYLKMKGDYHRYLAEFKTGVERKEAAESTLFAYKAAQDIAVAELAPTHPIRLGLTLNFSVFYYEILNSPDRACNLAKQDIIHLGLSLLYHITLWCGGEKVYPGVRFTSYGILGDDVVIADPKEFAKRLWICGMSKDVSPCSASSRSLTSITLSG